jgi:hypothetical protein
MDSSCHILNDFISHHSDVTPYSLLKIEHYFREAFSLYPHVEDFENGSSRFSKTALNFYDSRWCHIAEDSNAVMKINNTHGQCAFERKLRM